MTTIYLVPSKYHLSKVTKEETEMSNSPMSLFKNQETLGLYGF